MPALALNERQMRLMAQVLQCTKTDPVIDFPKLAKLGGYSTPKSAQDQWNKVKSKIKAAGNDSDTQLPKVQKSPSPASPSSCSSYTSAKKRNSTDDVVPLLAAKRPKRITKKPESYEMAPEWLTEDEEESPIAKSQTGEPETGQSPATDEYGEF